jgi:hypothetical protein
LVEGKHFEEGTQKPILTKGMETGNLIVPWPILWKEMGEGKGR